MKNEPRRRYLNIKNIKIKNYIENILGTKKSSVYKNEKNKSKEKIKNNKSNYINVRDEIDEQKKGTLINKSNTKVENLINFKLNYPSHNDQKETVVYKKYNKYISKNENI